jgi:aldehyde dehydrogenase (NAD+)
VAHNEEFYIGGTWVTPVSLAYIDVINPANGEVFTRVAAGTAADIDRAVAAAKSAFPALAQTTRADRLALLHAIVAAYKRRYDDLTEAVMSELGAPRQFAHEQQVFIGLAHLEKTIEVLKRYEFNTPRGSTMVSREPIGVAGLITPWNWPLNQIVCKVAPALAVGCTMVLKPSEVTPLNAIIFAEIMHEAGVPPGVFNLVNGDGPSAGAALAAHPDVDVMSFTGSTRAGIAVAKAAADTVKRVLQELGGKSPNIILADCDLDQAVTAGVAACFINSGQSCDAATRMLVPAALHDRAAAIAKSAADMYKLGAPDTPGADMGPVVNAMQYSKIQNLIETGMAEGAQLVAGGPGHPAGLEQGYYVKPTVFANVTPEMVIAREEIFGPVLAIMPYRDEAEAIRIANDTPYGLAAYIAGNDIAHARQLATHLRAGSVYLNYPPLDLDAPFGGYRQSGNGREYADFAFDDFTEIKGIIGYAPA